MPVAKKKEIEANDGSYEGLVLAKFDELFDLFDDLNLPKPEHENNSNVDG